MQEVIDVETPVVGRAGNIVGLFAPTLFLSAFLLFCFEPMDHGRHRAAGPSGEAEELDELQPAGSQADRLRVGGMQLGAARGGELPTAPAEGGRSAPYRRTWISYRRFFAFFAGVVGFVTKPAAQQNAAIQFDRALVLKQ